MSHAFGSVRINGQNKNTSLFWWPPDNGPEHPLSLKNCSKTTAPVDLCVMGCGGVLNPTAECHLCVLFIQEHYTIKKAVLVAIYTNNHK